MRKIIFSVLLLQSVCMVAYAEPTTQLQALLVKINTMQASFTQTVFSENNKILQTYNGSMEFKKPNLFRWEVAKPDASLLVTDGKKLWNYDVDLEQVTVQPYTTDREITPLSFVLEDGTQLNKNFTVEQMPNSCFKLTPKQEAQNFINVAVCFNNSLIKSLTIVDHLGQNSVFEFSQVKNNLKIADQRFSFTPPAGVDVVGE